MEDGGIFEELKKLDVRSRCMGYNKEGKRCRTRLRKTQYLFCSDAHKPLNQEIIEDGCFCCTEKLVNHKEVLFFRCKHAVHRKCYYEWMEASQNEVAICMLCRSPIFTDKKYMQGEDGVWIDVSSNSNEVEKILYTDPTPEEDKPLSIILKKLDELISKPSTPL